MQQLRQPPWQRGGESRPSSRSPSADKIAAIEELLKSGHVVAMVATASTTLASLVQADLGISMGGGTDVAIQAMYITLVQGDLTKVAPRST